MTRESEYSYRPVSSLMSTDYLSLKIDMSVAEALEYIRQNSQDDQIVYFYVTDDDNVLKGVVPTRRLLTSSMEEKIKEIMLKRIKYVPAEASVLDVWEMFIFHKYLALPVVDKAKHLIGVINISVFTDNVADLIEHERTDDIFESIGFKLSQVRYASPIRVFRYRFPWLTASIISGIVSALMVSRYEMLLSQTIILAFFLTLVLGLGESVSMQSMTVTIQTLRNAHLTPTWYFHALWKELKTALLLGTASGLIIFLTIILWKGTLIPAAVIGGSLILTLTAACIIGFSIPATLHILRLDLKIASGPLTLALADIFTILVYFSLAGYFL